MKNRNKNIDSLLTKESKIILNNLLRNKVVQISKITIYSELLQKISDQAKNNGFEVFSQLAISGTHKLTYEIFRTLLGNDIITNIEQSLDQRLLTTPSPSSGGNISQTQWMYYDDYFGSLIFKKELWERKILLIIEPPQVISLSDISTNYWGPPDYSTIQNMEIAELVSATLYKHSDENLMILILSDQETLSENLPYYLTRWIEKPFRIVDIPLYSDIYEGVVKEKYTIKSLFPKEAQIDLVKTELIRKILPLQVFISYAREDAYEANRVFKYLKDYEGIKPWIDSEELLPGKNWKVMIKQAIRKSAYFIALLSSNSVSKKGFVQSELKIALEMLDEFPKSKIFLIPVRIDKCEPEDEKLKDIHWVDLFDSFENSLEKIINVFKRELNIQN